MVYVVDKTRSDGVAFRLCEQIKTDLPIVLVSRSEELNFNEEILNLRGKPYVMLDFTELGYDWNMEFGHHFGVNTDKFPGVFHMDKWKVFDDFVRDNPPILTFCRELLKEDVKENVLPISYPCFIEPIPIQTKEEFNNRFFEIFYSFGISHEYRKELHAQIWAKSGQYGYSVSDNLFTLDQFINAEKQAKKWLSCHIPWYSRQPIETITKINGLAKISISIAGAGTRCFRHSESPVNSVMMLWNDAVAWPRGMEWIHNVNSIKCNMGNEIECVVEALSNPNLYDIYLAGVENIDKYRIDRYCSEYIEPLINNS
jgi:hypothetical protein